MDLQYGVLYLILTRPKFAVYAALWVRIKTSLKNTTWATSAKEWPTHSSPQKNSTCRFSFTSWTDRKRVSLAPYRFFKNSQRYYQLKLRHQCQCNRRSHLSPDLHWLRCSVAMCTVNWRQCQLHQWSTVTTITDCVHNNLNILFKKSVY